ncbi:S-layer family protein, partial [Oscillatoriales cyanobacterium LEGE 11467]
SIVTPFLSVTNGAQLEALSESNASAGNVVVEAENAIEVSGVNTGLFANSPGRGNAGTIVLKTDRLTVREGGEIIVTSENAGAAGNLEIVAPDIRLERGTLGAETVEGDRANILLDTSDIQLREQSLITTNATGTATGGNINIDTTTLVALDNSDITANAQHSFGGRVTIVAEGIFGTEFRDRLTPESDITATSELGAEFSGTVTILTPDIDAAAGLVELASNTTDPTDRVVTGCAAASGSSFVSTGRGGLPEDPTATIRGQTLWEDVRTVAPEIPEARSNLTPVPSSPSMATQPPKAIVEATGWIVREDGKVELVAGRPQIGDLISTPDCQDL